MLSSENLTDEFFEELNRYHDDPSKNARFAAVREVCVQMMKVGRDNCPSCADRTKALQYVRSVRMWANSAIALEGVGE